MELWFTEKHTPNAGLTLKIKRTLYSNRSEYQQINVLETEEFGRLLLLDGLVMTTERDEAIYHEMLVHPPLHIHPGSENVLIIGGGDGGAVREALKYPGLRGVTLCEIDREVVEVARRFFPRLSKGLDDPRVEVVFEDGSRILQDLDNQLDVILVDSTDPIGAAKALFTKKFYSSCHKALKEGGILCAQSESPIYHTDIIRSIKADLLEAGFQDVRFYTAPVPTYPGGFWSWVIASKKEIKISDQAPLPREHYEAMYYFNREILKAAFCLPNFFKKALE